MIFSFIRNGRGIWPKKINQDNVKPNIIHLYDIESFGSWFNQKDEHSYYCYLVDYNLNAQKTGLDIIENYQLYNSAYMVTTQYTDQILIEKCQAKKIPLIAKPMIHYMGIKLYRQDVELILIDDNVSLGRVWQIRAEVCNKRTKNCLL